jgi:hypothetical protein
VGDGSTKYLDSNRKNSADPQNSNHNAVWNTSGAGFAIGTGINRLGRNFMNGINTSIRSTTVSGGFSGGNGFWGTNRSLPGEYSRRRGGITAAIAVTSQVPSDIDNVTVFAYSDGNNASTNRIAFYSIGESLDLAALDTRVSALITAIGAAIV